MYIITRHPNQPQEKCECPVCHHGESRRTLTVDASNPMVKVLDLSMCLSCGTAFFTTEDPVLGYQEASRKDGMLDNYWLHYVQVGAGISSMVGNLFALGDRLKGDLVDVGCGFGFVVDFWRSLGDRNAIGLESASYGAKGAQILDITVEDMFLEEYIRKTGKTFDVVFSSEVIEHVSQPEQFLRDIFNALKPDGVLILTTPSASIIGTVDDDARLFAALSPGFHYFLLSENALRMLLKKAGFANVHIHDNGTSLFAWASSGSLPTPDLSLFDWDVYFQYLEKLSRNENCHVRGGALYRLFKDSLNLGRLDIAERIYPKFFDCALADYKLDMRNPDIAGFLEAGSLTDGLERHPAWFACGLLFGGLAVEKFENDKETALRMIVASEKVIQHSKKIGLQFAQEAAHFLPYARVSKIRLMASLIKETLTEIASAPSLDKHIQNTLQLSLADLKNLANSLTPQ